MTSRYMDALLTLQLKLQSRKLLKKDAGGIAARQARSNLGIIGNYDLRKWYEQNEKLLLGKI